MSDEINEDLIEATIRKVAAARAAREQELGGGDDSPEPGLDDAHTEAELAPAQQDGGLPDEPAPEEDEDPIEATIRRVAAERAAREAATTAPPEAPAAEAPEPIGAAPDPVAPAHEPIPPAPEPPPPAEPIAADDDDDAVEPPPHIPTVPRSSAPEEPAPMPRPAAARRSAPAAPAPAADLDVASTLLRIEETLTATQEGIRALVARIDDVLAATHGAGRPASAPPAQDEDDWDERPQVSPLPFAAPARPALMRDPAPHAATAERLVEDAPQAAPPGPVPHEPDAGPPPQQPDPRRGWELLPRTYRITVEDKRRGVDLVPLHRALLGMDGVKDMSLLSYNNGVAIVALETVGDIELDVLRGAVGHAMSRAVEVEQHNEQTLVVKLAEE